jgi:hypothetical protein
LMGGWNTVGGQHRTAQGKGQCKNGVLPLDHLQSGLQVFHEGHGLIVKEKSGLSVCRLIQVSACSLGRPQDQSAFNSLQRR